MFQIVIIGNLSPLKVTSTPLSSQTPFVLRFELLIGSPPAIWAASGQICLPSSLYVGPLAETFP